MKHCVQKVVMILIFFGSSSLYAMQSFRSLGLRHAFSLFGLSYLANQYIEKKSYASYEEFLDKEKPTTINDSFRYKELKSDAKITLATDVHRIMSRVSKKRIEAIVLGPIEYNFSGIKKLQLQSDDKKNEVADADLNDLKEVALLKFRVFEGAHGQGCECRIDLLKTKKKFRNRGYAGLLLEDLEKEMRLSNCSKIFFYAEKGKEQFYEKKGYQEIEVGSQWMHKELQEIKV